MSTIEMFQGTGFWLVQVKRRHVFGTPRYWAECFNCGQPCCRKPHYDKRIADRHAEAHQCDTVTVGTRPSKKPHGNSLAARGMT